jgi:flavodoxin
MKSLVVFYSLTFKTKLVAETIAEAFSADMVEIKEAKASRAGARFFFSAAFSVMTNRNIKLAPIDVDLKQYDRVFIGSPIWAAKPTPAISTFIKTSNFEGREVITFFTMGSDKSEKAIQNITAKIERSQGRVIGSFAITSQDVTDEEIKAKASEAIQSYLP